MLIEYLHLQKMESGKDHDSYPLCRWDQTVERLVRLGIDVNTKNDVDMTALHYAAVGFLC
jgi:hypothetical protein